MTSISETRYKDQPAVTIESDVIAAQFLPSIGAKMSSLVHKPLSLELMVQRPNAEYLLQLYDGDYVAGECSGFDDMFPTIDVCHYEDYPWQGTRLPDHGEVWSIPWDLDIDEDRLHLATYGVRLPYRLEKWVSFNAPGVLRIDYRLTNLSGFALDFLWAAHTMLNMEEGAQLLLPAGVRHVVATFTIGGCMGDYGRRMAWPVCELPDGTKRDLRVMRPKQTRQADKFYVDGPMPEGWCAFTYPKSGVTLGLSFPVERVPCLGILPNEGGWNDLYNMFLEPCTAPFDRPDVAKLHDAVSTVGPRSTYEWHLAISVAEGTDYRRVTEGGALVTE
jgi:hypothetical protein